MSLGLTCVLLPSVEEFVYKLINQDVYPHFLANSSQLGILSLVIDVPG